MEIDVIKNAGANEISNGIIVSENQSKDTK